MYRVVMICTGNTCRSPMAEGILRMLLGAEMKGGRDAPPIEVSSAGVAAGPGAVASPEAVAVCRSRGIDIASHRSRQLTAELLLSCDLVIAMENHHRETALRMRPEAAGGIVTLAELAGANPTQGIADPIGGDRSEYEAAFGQIEEYLRRSLQAIVSRAQNKLTGVGERGGERSVRIEIGCDHRGFALKEKIILVLNDWGHEVVNHGCDSSASADYPDHAYAVARAVAKRPGALGVVICSNGVGVSMVANKVPGVRAALCMTPAMADQSRRHNDANVLALGADTVSEEENIEILATWLKAAFEGGRHRRRVEQIRAGECR